MKIATSGPRDLQKIGIVAITLGVGAIVLMLYVYRDSRKTLAGDLREVAGLQRQLDSVRALHRTATDSATAKRFREEVTMRENGLSRRAFHIPMRQESVRRWWTLSGAGVRWSIISAILLAIGTIVLRSVRRGGSDATRTPHHGGS